MREVKGRFYPNTTKKPLKIKGLKIGGAGESRTPVQTHSPKAFYMLISLLFVGMVPEKNKPIPHVAE
jgi:hypothetical protein